MPDDSEDTYQKSKLQAYLERNYALSNVTYPVYYQWWRKCTANEQSKAENSVKQGLTPYVEDEFD